MDPRVDAAGVVLAGGRSSRMGTPKAALEWHGSTLLYRTAALLARTVGGPVIVVSAPGQELPRLPSGVGVVTDPVPGLGPLQGIAAGLAAVSGAAGLAAVSGAAAAAFVCSTDLPFLHPAFVRCVLSALDRPPGVDAGARAETGVAPFDVAPFDVAPVDVALPFARGYRQPLAAAYRTALAGPITQLLAAGKRRPGMLFERCRVAQLDDAVLLADPAVAALDPGLESVTNINEPADYAAARARVPEPVAVEVACGRRTVRAASLGGAAAAVGAALNGACAITVNGREVQPDPHFPLVAGDTVAFSAVRTPTD
ncbi:MAG TPA: molybdenum cofactor guanylyltransferase [Pseudonocardia sp.]